MSLLPPKVTLFRLQSNIETYKIMARKIICSLTIRKVQGFLGKNSLDSLRISYKIPANPMMLSLVPARSNFQGNLVENGGVGDVYLSPLDKKARPTFVDVADFETVIATYDDADKNREIVIKTSRDIVKGAKKAIYDLHRNLIAEAKEKISEAESAIDSLAPIVEVFLPSPFPLVFPIARYF